jgi:uncharacterized membrane protein
MFSQALVKNLKKINNKQIPTMVSSTQRIARLSIFTALSVVGSFIHPPSPISSVAFDSSPGFFSALYFGIWEGTLISGIGHIITSIINGFPLGVYHLPIALSMALAGGAIGLINKLNKKWGFIPAIILGIIINTASVVVVVPLIGWEGAIAFIPSLLLSASLNGILAVIVFLGIREKKLF